MKKIHNLTVGALIFTIPSITVASCSATRKNTFKDFDIMTGTKEQFFMDMHLRYINQFSTKSYGEFPEIKPWDSETWIKGKDEIQSALGVEISSAPFGMELYAQSIHTYDLHGYDIAEVVVNLMVVKKDMSLEFLYDINLEDLQFFNSTSNDYFLYEHSFNVSKTKTARDIANSLQERINQGLVHESTLTLEELRSLSFDEKRYYRNFGLPELPSDINLFINSTEIYDQVTRSGGIGVIYAAVQGQNIHHDIAIMYKTKDFAFDYDRGIQSLTIKNVMSSMETLPDFNINDKISPSDVIKLLYEIDSFEDEMVFLEQYAMLNKMGYGIQIREAKVVSKTENEIKISLTIGSNKTNNTENVYFILSNKQHVLEKSWQTDYGKILNENFDFSMFNYYGSGSENFIYMNKHLLPSKIDGYDIKWNNAWKNSYTYNNEEIVYISGEIIYGDKKIYISSELFSNKDYYDVHTALANISNRIQTNDDLSIIWSEFSFARNIELFKKLIYTNVNGVNLTLKYDGFLGDSILVDVTAEKNGQKKSKSVIVSEHASSNEDNFTPTNSYTFLSKKTHEELLNIVGNITELSTWKSKLGISANIVELDNYRVKMVRLSQDRYSSDFIVEIALSVGSNTKLISINLKTKDSED